MKAVMQNLLSLPLFKGLASDELDTILGKVNALVKHFEKSDYIYLAGDAVESIGTVSYTHLDVYKRQDYPQSI